MRDFRRAILRGFYEQCGKICPNWLRGKIYRYRVGSRRFAGTSQMLNETAQRVIGTVRGLDSQSKWNYGATDPRDFRDPKERPDRRMEPSCAFSHHGLLNSQVPLTSVSPLSPLSPLSHTFYSPLAIPEEENSDAETNNLLSEKRENTHSVRESTPNYSISTCITLEPSPSPICRLRSPSLTESTFSNSNTIRKLFSDINEEKKSKENEKNETEVRRGIMNDIIREPDAFSPCTSTGEYSQFYPLDISTSQYLLHSEYNPFDHSAEKQTVV